MPLVSNSSTGSWTPCPSAAVPRGTPCSSEPVLFRGAICALTWSNLCFMFDCIAWFPEVVVSIRLVQGKNGAKTTKSWVASAPI
jgi:hypothetical protein